MRAEIDRAPTLDSEAIAQLRELSPIGGDQTVVLELIDIFVKTTPDRLALMEAAVEKSDATGVSEQAHCLKSSSATVGAARLSKLFAALEATAGGTQAELRELVRDARSEFKLACAALLKEFPGGS